jgi:hypothetical protein
MVSSCRPKYFGIERVEVNDGHSIMLPSFIWPGRIPLVSAARETYISEPSVKAIDSEVRLG